LTVTIQDVAKAAGVSVSTVSRVLNDKADVAPDTYRKVQGVINQLSYSSSLAAKSMRSRRTNVIGLVTNNVKEPFNIEIIRGANRAIDQYGYDLIVYTGQHKVGKEREAWELRQIARLNGSLTDGIIMTAPLAKALPTTFPLVAIDSHLDGFDFPAVIATNHAGALQVMTYLIGLGHRHIAFISGHPYLQSSARRLEGYQEGLRRANIPIRPDLIETGDYSRPAGYHCTHRLLNRPSPPTAIFAANDAMAIGVLKAAQEMGIPIPDELSVVGFDNIPQAMNTDPPLTTVDQSIEEMGYIATKMLIQIVQGEPLEREIHKVQTQLIIRDSCRAI
jgi:LacI family transcriptional regulator